MNFATLKIKQVKRKSILSLDLPQYEAIVEFYDAQDKLIEQKVLPYFPQELIFQMIEKKYQFNLTGAIIVDFDLDVYRQIKNLPEEKFITIKDFNAENAIFYSDKKISFRRANFIGDFTLFRKAVFIAPKISFENANFEKTETSFHAIIFRTQDLSFAYAKFGQQYHDFRNARFSGVKNFEGVVFRGGEVDFVGVDFGDGDINFTSANFGVGRVLFRMSIFGKGKKDFSRANFGQGDISFEKVEFNDGDVIFRSTIFGNGKKDFRRCTFGKGKKNFANAVFNNGTLEFVGTDFGTGKVIFKLAQFGRGDKDFHYCHFGDGDIQFDKTQFGDGIIDFRAVDFDNCRVIFNHIELSSGDIIFEASQMQSGFITFKNSLLGRGEFNFKNIVYPNSDLIIENIDFGQGAVSFYLAKVKNLIFQSSQINNYLDLRIASCERLDMSNTVIKDVVDFHTHTTKININSLDFRGVRLLGQIYIDWESLNLKKLIRKQDSTWQEKADQFRMLKENFHNLGMYEQEDLAYVEFKRCEARAILERRKQKGIINKVLGYIIHWLKVLVMDKMGHYATNPIRVLTSMVLIYLIFTLLYMILEYFNPNPQIISSLFDPNDPRVLNNVAKAFYHSAITFLTIGYGDYYPNGISRWISAIEGFIGLFMMSYFTVAFVRKILR